MAPRQKSIVWSFFDKSTDNQFAVCRLCNQKLKYFISTGNLKQHIVRKHSIEYNRIISRDIADENDPGVSHTLSTAHQIGEVITIPAVENLNKSPLIDLAHVPSTSASSSNNKPPQPPSPMQI